jgi:dihydrodipicolinate reductase
MVLLQQAAAAAARFYDHAELTELHHNRKADAPSGTCIKTAELMEELGKASIPRKWTSTNPWRVAAVDSGTVACGCTPCGCRAWWLTRK